MVESGIRYDGTRSWAFLCGIDYRLSSGFLFGLLAQFDWADESDDIKNIAAQGHGWMVGPYTVVRLGENLIFDGRVAWGRSDNEVDPIGFYHDDFSTTRWLARARLTGDLQLAGFSVQPHVGIIYFEEDQKAYRDSLGILIPSQDVSLGRLTFGPRIATHFLAPNDTIISPYIELKGIWDFDKANIVDLDTGIPTSQTDELRARVEGGISIVLPNGWSIKGEGFYDGIGADDLDAYGGSAKVTVPLN